MLPGSPISASYPGTVEARRAIVLGCDRVDTGDTWPAAEGAQAGRGDAPGPSCSPRRRISAGCAGIAGPRMPTTIRRCGTCCEWALTRRTPGFCGGPMDGGDVPPAGGNAIRSGAPNRRHRHPANPGPGDRRGTAHWAASEGRRRPRLGLVSRGRRHRPGVGGGSAGRGTAWRGAVPQLSALVTSPSPSSTSSTSLVSCRSGERLASTLVDCLCRWFAVADAALVQSHKHAPDAAGVVAQAARWRRLAARCLSLSCECARSSSSLRHHSRRGDTA